MKSQIIVLGAGISGLSLAWKLSTNGSQVCVLEKGKIVGGLARTERENGYCMDVGPHSFFTEDIEIRDTVLNLLSDTLQPEPRRVKFFYQGKYLDYPLTAFSVLFQMGIISGMRAGFSFLNSKLFFRNNYKSNNHEQSVEDWAIGSFGNHLYQTFFKPYTEQFWKISCKELSARSIPAHTRTSFLNTLRLLVQKRLAKRGSSLVEREMLPTYYPDTGYGEIPERVADAAEKCGAEILKECNVVEVEELSDSTVVVRYEKNGEVKEMTGNHVVSTIPLNNFIKMLKPSPSFDVLMSAEKLDYRSFIALGMVTEKQNILDCSYMYVLNRPYNRISEMNRFSPKTSPKGENIILLEIPCLMNSAAWNATKEELFEMCIGSLSKDGVLLPGDVKRLLLIKEPHAYPVYRLDYAQHLKKLLNYINERKTMSTLGRLGEFMYMDIDKCMKRAFALADKFSNNL